MSDDYTEREALEKYCEIMHDAYEVAAIGAGWETQHASRKPWSEVPEPNKITMRAAVSALLVVTTAEADRRVEAMRERAASFAAHHMFPPPMDHTYEMEQGILALPLTESEAPHE